MCTKTVGYWTYPIIFTCCCDNSKLNLKKCLIKKMFSVKNFFLLIHFDKQTNIQHLEV